MDGYWIFMGFPALSGICGGLIAIEKTLRRIAVALEEKNKLQSRQTQP